jgi:hypothetical protein
VRPFLVVFLVAMNWAMLDGLVPTEIIVVHSADLPKPIGAGSMFSECHSGGLASLSTAAPRAAIVRQGSF